jgi:hypothetical protein
MAAVAYVIQGTPAECPHCGHKRFNGPAQVNPGDRVVCASCRQVCIVDPSVPTGMRGVGAKKSLPQEPNLRRREGTS